jgi:DNA polymerase III epsilon subunit-like protein
MNSILNITPECKLNNWAKKINKLLSEGIDIFIVGDTETTGVHELGDKKNFGKKDRILEIGFLFFVACENNVIKPLNDDDGVQIFFHEYINPFKEDYMTLERYNSVDSIPAELIKFVHGIDLNFLNGNSGLVMRNGSRGQFKLERPAPTFAKVKPFLSTLMNCEDLIHFDGKIHFIAHNALFDVQTDRTERSMVGLRSENV